MLVLLSCAKTMSVSSKVKTPTVTISRFMNQTSEIAFQMSRFMVDELEKLLHANPKIAVENYHRFQEFHSADIVGLPALLAYTGIVFKHLNPFSFTQQDFQYAQNHLRLTSFLYGLLRPLDNIRPYRLEGSVRLPELGGKNLFSYWEPHLTEMLIDDVRQQGGVLCNLASGEMKGLFRWSTVKKEVKIITPEFKTVKNGKLKTIVIYAKMARGEMTRYILQNRITDTEMLKTFTWEGFEYNEELSSESNLVFVNGIVG